ncbi:hypothetical protein PVOR_20859 [Paenibacillus vortex V453]|jgi:hypothetical protein|uniref:Uncharacterized protein n=2 Tax=Paenibacillus TaxID=44249 RepID=A0A163DVA7_9BACL|nr:hypothetical protein A3958_24060 [Paenibacillus glucanolyticus]AWP27217.1 hypothetical protein B9D94_11535 [Paenibacillus sp. Cedars]EFU39783.1 hypothetical protein PVOR_20859 [Paenibacillus vortex V453]ETT42800.1 hypothetical protein C169_02782 [Paenibacillus sp. FSL R5-808]MDH6670617.1 hypothetical protein [Paenibacillus sp. LBL]
MIIKKTLVCAIIFVVILAAAILTDSRTRSRYQPDNTSYIQRYQMQDFQEESRWFSPREYIKIIRKSPESGPDQP